MTYAEYEIKQQNPRPWDVIRHGILDEDEELVTGPMPGAIDREDACSSLKRRLDSWHTLITPTKYGYMHNGEITPDSIPQYLRDIEDEQRRAVDEAQRTAHAWGYRSEVDERPYFYDPAPLGFNPYEAIHNDKPEQHEGVSLRQSSAITNAWERVPAKEN